VVFSAHPAISSIARQHVSLSGNLRDLSNIKFLLSYNQNVWK
jgi:hypothetical protein